MPPSSRLQWRSRLDFADTLDISVIDSCIRIFSFLTALYLPWKLLHDTNSETVATIAIFACIGAFIASVIVTRRKRAEIEAANRDAIEKAVQAAREKWADHINGPQIAPGDANFPQAVAS